MTVLKKEAQKAFLIIPCSRQPQIMRIHHHHLSHNRGAHINSRCSFVLHATTPSCASLLPLPQI